MKLTNKEIYRIYELSMKQKIHPTEYASVRKFARAILEEQEKKEKTDNE